MHYLFRVFASLAVVIVAYGQLVPASSRPMLFNAEIRWLAGLREKLDPAVHPRIVLVLILVPVLVLLFWALTERKAAIRQ